jgi:hypothetical protein
LFGLFKCMLKALRVLRSNGAACFAAPVSGPARGKATSRNCSHSLRKRWTTVPKPNSGKRTPGTKSNWTMTWGKRPKECIQAFRFHDPRKTHWHSEQRVPGILWDMPTLSVQFDIGDIARFSTSSSPVQPFVENQDIYLESKAKPSQESILFCRLDSKNILPRTRLIWLTTQKDMNLRRLPAPSLRNGLKERKCSLPYQDLRGLKWRTQKKKHQCAPSTCLRKEGGIPPVQQKIVWDATEGTRPAW